MTQPETYQFRLLDKSETVKRKSELQHIGVVAYGQYASVLAPEHAATLQQNMLKDDTWNELFVDSYCFVCEHNNTIVGMAYLIPSGHPWMFFKSEWSYIRIVGVLPEHSGHSIGKKLTQLCIDKARALGEQTITLHTSEIMNAARHIYEDLGFTILHELDPRLGIRYWLYSLDLTKNNKNEYLFTSERLGFRNWREQDIEPMAEINADKEVMEFFSNTQTQDQTTEFIKRMQKQFNESGFCYFAVETLHNQKLIGFIGLNKQVFESDFTPCIDIGWRLTKTVWNKGYATEGANRCLTYAFNELQLEKVYSITPNVNLKSERIMQKIGMQKVKHFIFPPLGNYERLKECVLYEISKEMFSANN